MKRISLLFSVFAISVSALFANNTQPAQGLLQDDLSRIDNEFAQLDQLEQTVNQSGQTYTQLAAENNPLVQQLTYNGDISATLLGGAAGDERLWGIPGFFWGFCLGILGIILVYVVLEDSAAKKREGRQAMIGCAVWVVLWVVLWLGFLGSAAWWAA